jgi:hypothetical protein
MKFLHGHTLVVLIWYIIDLTVVVLTLCVVLNMKCFDRVGFETMTAVLMKIKVFLDFNSA